MNRSLDKFLPRLLVYPFALEKHLGLLVPEGATLPLVFVCPLCSTKALWIYWSNFYKCEWAHCRSCQVSGDIFELVAASHQISLREAAVKLTGASKDKADRYISAMVMPRVHAKDLWQQLQTLAPHDSIELADLHRFLGLTVHPDREVWRHGIGQHMGCTMSSYPDMDAEGQHAVKQIRAATKAGRYMVLPFYDLPGSPSMFVAVGIHTRLEGTEFAMYCFPAVAGRFMVGKECSTHDCGFFPVQALWSSCARFGSKKIFLLLDELLTLRLQERHLRDHSELLPVIACCNDIGKTCRGTTRTVELSHSLTMLAGRELVVWAPPGKHLMAQSIAKKAGGLWSGIAPPDSSRWYTDWLFKLQDSAEEPTELAQYSLR